MHISCESSLTSIVLLLQKCICDIIFNNEVFFIRIMQYIRRMLRVFLWMTLSHIHYSETHGPGIFYLGCNLKSIIKMDISLNVFHGDKSQVIVHGIFQKVSPFILIKKCKACHVIEISMQFFTFVTICILFVFEP